ncbi:MAG: MazG family protein [Desulfuromonadales bacterium]|nr:MazG family protein [Desulfuromonadales bacterium]
MNRDTDGNAIAALERLLQTMRTLRGPGGCEWDREQSPDSLKKYILEEAYELVHAIDTADPEEICEELGDLLLQIVFQAQIFEEMKLFGIAEVASSIDRKLKRRHPHIFAGTDPATREEDWNRIKREERTEKGKPLNLASCIPQALPALKRAEKLAGCLARDTNESVQPLSSLRRITGYLAELGQTTDLSQSTERQIGNILFQMTLLARSLDIDAEEALRTTVEQRIKDHDSRLPSQSKAL